MSLEQLYEEMNAYFGYDISKLTRERKYVYARAAFFYISQKLNDKISIKKNKGFYSLSEIGRKLNKDHSTVLHANKNHKTYSDYSPIYRSAISHFENRIKPEYNGYSKVFQQTCKWLDKSLGNETIKEKEIKNNIDYKPLYKIEKEKRKNLEKTKIMYKSLDLIPEEIKEVLSLNPDRLEAIIQRLKPILLMEKIRITHEEIIDQRITNRDNKRDYTEMPI